MGWNWRLCIEAADHSSSELAGPFFARLLITGLVCTTQNVFAKAAILFSVSVLCVAKNICGLRKRCLQMCGLASECETAYVIRTLLFTNVSFNVATNPTCLLFGVDKHCHVGPIPLIGYLRLLFTS